MISLNSMRTTALAFGQPLVIGLLALGLQTNHAAAKEAEEQFHQSYALNSDGQLRLDNVNGKVQIASWDKAEVQIDAVKRARNQKELEATKIEVDSKPERLTVHTKYPKMKKNSTRVDYEIKVPAGTHLAKVENVNGTIEISGVRGPVQASTVNGTVSARNLAADAKIETVNGTVVAAFDRLDGVKSISVQAVNGKVEVVLPANANAEVNAESVNGHIQADKLAVKKNWPIGSELHGKLGTGATRVKAETVNGSIRVKLTGPTDTQQLEENDKS